MPADTHPEQLTTDLPRANVTMQLGRADNLRAELFLNIGTQVPISTNTKLSLVATLTGPESTRATTLPVRLPVKMVFKERDSDTPGVTGKVILTEPAYWTPDVPMLYRVKGDLLSDAEPIACFDTTVGLRRLGIRGHSIWLEGHRWVLRGCDGSASNCSPEHQIARAQHAGLAAVINLGPDGLRSGALRDNSSLQCLQEANRHGQPLLVYLNPATHEQVAQATVMSLTRHPSVVIVVLPMKLIPMASSLKPPAGTLLLAAEVNASEPPTDPEPGIDIHIVRLSRDGVPAEAWRRPPDVPAIALGSASQLDRRACDRLQSNLATWRMTGKGPPSTWDWTGFLIQQEIQEMT